MSNMLLWESHVRLTLLLLYERQSSHHVSHSTMSLAKMGSQLYVPELFVHGGGCDARHLQQPHLTLKILQRLT